MNDQHVPTIEVEPIYSPEAIADRLECLAQDIVALKLERPLIVAVLKGSFVFAADLIRALHKAGFMPEVDFLTLSSYRRNRTSSGSVEILRDLDLVPEGRNILIIDDVLDSGRTLAFAKDLLAARGATSIHTCVLINKQVPRAVNVQADFYAFECGAEFVVGYGMDVAHRYRELPFVGRITKE